MIAKVKHQGFEPMRSKPLERRVSDEEEDNTRLPDEYASEILDLEIDCEAQDVNIEKVRKLMGLYTQAIDYYVAHQSDKYKYFQKKMTNLMIQPQVVESMEVAHQRKVREAEKLNAAKELEISPSNQQESIEAVLHSPRPNVQRVDAQLRRQKFEMHKHLNSIAQNDKMKEFVLSHEMTTTRNNVIIQSNLKQQLESLSSRLQQRKMVAKTGSTMSGFTKEIQREASARSARSDSRDKAMELKEEDPHITFQSGLKRCGSHKVISTRKTENPGLFVKQ